MKTRDQAEDRLKELIESGEINSLDAAKQEGFIKGWKEAQADKQTCGFCVEPKQEEEKPQPQEKVLSAKEYLLDNLKEFHNHDEYDPKLIDAISDFMNGYVNYRLKPQPQERDVKKLAIEFLEETGIDIPANYKETYAGSLVEFYNAKIKNTIQDNEPKERVDKLGTNTPDKSKTYISPSTEIIAAFVNDEWMQFHRSDTIQDNGLRKAKEEALDNLLALEKKLTMMFDSDVRVALALLDEIRKLNQNKDE